MKCAICKQGELEPGFVSVTLLRGDTTVIVKGVPGEICDVCGEYFLADGITEHLRFKAEEAARKGAAVEIMEYAASAEIRTLGTLGSETV